MWDLSRYDFATGEAPDTVDPSLWRQLEIMREGGLFEVAEGIYLRGRAGPSRASRSSRPKCGVVTIDARKRAGCREGLRIIAPGFTEEALRRT